MTAPAPAAPWWKQYAKAVAGVLAGLSPSAVVGLLALIGVHIDTDTAVLVCGVLGALLGGGTVAVVRNGPKAPG
ncbi:hypothetical protein [Amycolatopsis sp. YIM 10]|uniref:hypothetical protein n=1 Tax=Amycolatopsis sp. YIM 10 TaxID=2653857 RepID=UPI00128FFE7C|nr:hypothetical protein [Amycolatopsis sp. YIM 10]QFU87891.1 hypothetical protein YIM_13525 [Amycolatopsis sp. YIM 10]QFU94796.1 hypothetical protein YIM_48355 [Amycolatopsis sp. YIM 10]